MQFFGQYLKHVRLEQKISLSQTADRIGISSVDYSRIERGIDPAPEDTAQFAIALCLREMEAEKLQAVATSDKKTWTPKLPSTAEVIAKLPAFPVGLTEEQMKALVDCVRLSLTSRV